MTKEICNVSGAEWESKSKWETVLEINDTATERLKVPGGWIYHISHQQAELVNICFVPDPDKCVYGHNEYIVKQCLSCQRENQDRSDIP